MLYAIAYPMCAYIGSWAPHCKHSLVSKALVITRTRAALIRAPGYTSRAIRDSHMRDIEL